MEITRERLRDLYNTRSIAEIQKELDGICLASLYRLFDQAGIPRKRKNVRKNIRLVG